MRPEHEPRRPRPEPVPELDDEREIDFAQLGRTILGRWWLVAAAVVLGAVLGYLTSLGGGDVFIARTTVYLGQPLSPTGGGQILSLGTNPSTVTEIVRSDDVVERVAGQVGVSPGELRAGITTQAVGAADPARRQGQNPLIQISVRGPWREEAAQAANLLGDAVVSEVSGYVDVKADALREQLETQNGELRQIENRLEELHETTAGEGLTSIERLSLMSLVGFAEQRRGQLVNERTTTRQLLTLAETVERSDRINDAVAQSEPAQSPRSAMVVGGLIGLVAGLALALAWGPLVDRRRRT